MQDCISRDDQNTLTCSSFLGVAINYPEVKKMCIHLLIKLIFTALSRRYLNRTGIFFPYEYTMVKKAIITGTVKC